MWVEYKRTRQGEERVWAYDASDLEHAVELADAVLKGGRVKEVKV